MEENAKETASCQICGQAKDLAEVWPGDLVRGGIQESIKKHYPNWDSRGYICLADLNRFRARYVEDVLEEETGKISSLQEQVLKSWLEHELISKNINLEFEQDLTFWERLSDRVATFGGSWGFILGFAGIITLWIVINTVAMLAQPFDPYPYIFLNLVLSGLAGFQAPIILMSQGRQDAKDRLRSEHDYQLNLKAELEIRHLNEKMDLLLTSQWRRLLEIQRIQMEVMEECINGKTAAGAVKQP
jgi:uncharacterized membrane protein